MKRNLTLVVCIALIIGCIITPITSSLQISTTEINNEKANSSTKSTETSCSEPYKKIEFEKATIEGTFIPWPYDSQFILKLPCSYPFNRTFKNIEIRHFEGLIIPDNESKDSLVLSRYNGTNITTGYVNVVSVYLSGKDSTLIITKSSMHKGVYHIKGEINDLTVEIFESQLDADHGNIIVGFRNYMTILSAIAIGRLYRIRTIGFLRIFPFGYFVLYEVPVGEEYYWMARFNALRCVLSTELNTIGHGT